MALSLIYGLDIGEKRATSLSHKYHTLFDIAFASTSEIASVEGLGKLTAKKLQEALGNMEGVE
jgi:excinuclease UvrABC nuclease subunit